MMPLFYCYEGESCPVFISFSLFFLLFSFTVQICRCAMIVNMSKSKPAVCEREKNKQASEKKTGNTNEEIKQIINTFFYFIIIIGIQCHVPHAEQIICFHLAHFLAVLSVDSEPFRTLQVSLSLSLSLSLLATLHARYHCEMAKRQFNIILL